MSEGGDDANDGGGSSHVTVHVGHGITGLDTVAAGVEYEALADEGYGGVLARACGGILYDGECGLVAGAAGDAEEAAHVFFFQFFTT